MLLEGKGHFRARNYILRALLCAELHFEGTFVRGIVIRQKKIIILLVQYNIAPIKLYIIATAFSDNIEFQL